jgi:hypothetical protein
MNSQCSQAATERVSPTKEIVREQILDFVKTRGDHGVTADEIAEEWSCSPNHVAPRLTELLAAGRLIRTDRRRKTRAGCQASVLTLPRQPQISTPFLTVVAVPPAHSGLLFDDIPEKATHYPD